MNQVIDKETGEIMRHAPVEGYDNLDAQVDITMPRWRLVQPTSKIEGQQGQFNHNLTGEVLDSVQMVIVYITPSRVEFNAARKLVCYSHDGITGTRGACAGCKQAVWPEGGGAPKCGPGYTYIGMHPSTAELYAITAQGKSAGPAKAYHSSLFTARLSPWAVITEWRSKMVTDAKGKYYILTPKRTGITDEQVRETAREMAEWVKTIRFVEADEPLASAESRTSETPWENQEPEPDGIEEKFEQEDPR